MNQPIFRPRFLPRSISRDEKPGEVQDYRLREKLGSGSFGVVYRAEQVPLERTVALKMLKPRKRPKGTESEDTQARIKSQRIKDRNEFLREAQFTGKLEHPNIVPVHDIGLVKGSNGTGNRPFYVMKEIKGDSWQSKLKHNTRAENLEILRNVADAIDYAHDKNIIHCDLKPENVMLGEFGEVLVVDWGGAVDLNRRETFRPGGSPAYISPEMATYWCDIFLENKTTSPAINEVGTKSDVYLLGAMLFEIVTGSPPHFGLKGEDAYDVMRRATENQIRKHDQWKDDELMQIARKALRLDETETFETVHQFQEALRAYESQRVSIEMRERAEKLLKLAKETNDYDAYGKSRFGFEESIEKWEGNLQAKTGLRDARLSCAALALKDQNFDLGIGMLEKPETKEEKSLRDRLSSGKQSRDRRKRLVQLLSAVLLVGGIISIGLIVFAGIQMNRATDATRVAKEQTKIAEDKTKEATEQAEIAEAKSKLAEAAEAREQAAIVREREADERAREQTELAKKQEERAKQQEELAKNQEELAKQQEARAKREEKRAKQQEQIALQNELEAKRQERAANLFKESSQLLREKDQVVQIRSSIVSGDFSTAKKQLASVDEKAKSSWEWARLNMQTHPEAIDFLPEESEVVHASASEDGRKIVIVSAHEVSVHEATDFDKLVRPSIPIDNASVAAISPDGLTVAIGIPGVNSANGRLEIYEGDVQIVLDEAPSEEITDLQFSADGDRLVCVGIPDLTRKSAQFEKEVMIYLRGDEQWKHQVVVKDDEGNETTLIRPLTYPLKLTHGGSDPLVGTQPKFTNATFSIDGKRILLTNPQPDALAKTIHVFEDDGMTYHWIASSPSSDIIDAAAFANKFGTKVVGGRTTESTSEIFTWDVDSSSPLSQPLTEESGFQPVAAPVSELQPFGRLEGRIRTLKRDGDYLLTGGEDKRISLWNIETGELIKSFPGHSRQVDFCTFIAGEKPEQEAILVSVAQGANPEILRTNLNHFISDVEELPTSDSDNGENSPINIFRSQDATNVAIGSDVGLAVARMNDEIVEWEVSAWKSHKLTKDYLFAQTRRDHFLRYNRKTGAIDKVFSLRIPGQSDSTSIVKFQVSDDGRIGLVETSDQDAKEFQIWNLTDQTLIKKLSFGDLLGPNREKNELPTVALSPGGDYVVAGKVGFVVWSVEPDVDQPIYFKRAVERGFQWPNDLINNIVFLDGGNEFAISWPQAAARRNSSADDDSQSAQRANSLIQKARPLH